MSIYGNRGGDTDLDETSEHRHRENQLDRVARVEPEFRLKSRENAVRIELGYP